MILIRDNAFGCDGRKRCAVGAKSGARENAGAVDVKSAGKKDGGGLFTPVGGGQSGGTRARECSPVRGRSLLRGRARESGESAETKEH